jgi:integrase
VHELARPGKSGLRDSTLRDYGADLDNEVLPRFGHLKVPKVTADKIARFVRDLSGRGLSGGRVKNILKPLQGTLKLGVRRGLIFQSPFDLLTADERPKETPRKDHEWSPDEMDALLAASEALAREKDAKYDYSPILRVAAYTGLREAEVLGLRWRDLDLKKREIHVRQRRTGSRRVPRSTSRPASTSAAPSLGYPTIQQTRTRRQRLPANPPWQLIGKYSPEPAGIPRPEIA